MTIFARATRVLVICVSCSGCVGEPAYLTAPTKAQPQISFDGTYRASLQVTSASSSLPREWCETDRRPVFQIRDNNFSFSMPHPNIPGNYSLEYTVSIYSDGIMQGTSGDLGVLAGRVTGTHMQGVISGSGCEYSFSADRV